MAVTKFGTWTPDQPDYENQGLVDVINTYPGSGGWRRSLGQITAGANTITSSCKGVISFIDDQKASQTYVGTATKLFGLEGKTHVDYSRASGYVFGDENFWSFAKHGTDMYAVNGTDAMQFIDIGGTQFGDVTAAPVCESLAVVNGFLVGGATDGIASRIHWSGIGAPKQWPSPGSVTANATQSGRQTIDNVGGPIQAIAGGKVGFIFQENAITVMRYIGGSAVFNFESLNDVHGLIGPNAAVKVGNLVYFASRDGFYVFDGTKTIPIGSEKVDEFFNTDLDPLFTYKVQASSDPKDNTVIFSYPNTTASGLNNRRLVYNYVTDSWGKIHDTLVWTFSSFGRGITLEEMDTEVTSDLDTVPLSLDSSEYNRGRPVLSGYDSSHRLVDLSGTALTAVFQIAEFADPNGGRLSIQDVRPVIEASAVACEIGTRNLQTETETFTSSVTANTVGLCNFRAEGRYHRIRFTAHNLTLAYGYDVTSFPTGRH